MLARCLHDQLMPLFDTMQTVPWDFTLAAVRQWMWKRPEDLRLEYGVRQRGTELRPPVIKPPI